MRKIIVANWKMNGSLEFVSNFLPTLTTCLSSTPNQVIICPPYPYLLSAAQALKNTSAILGGQNCHTAPSGAFTGEVSATMLADMGCQAVIVGHSERRTLFRENDSLIKEKAAAIHGAGLKAIICIGESLSLRESGEAVHNVIQQLHASLPPSANAHNTMVAYEPIWAIGTGITPIPEEIIEMHQALHKVTQFPFPLLYGGSVTDKNVKEILSLPHVDGVLVGGASLKTESFQTIIG